MSVDYILTKFTVIYPLIKGNLVFDFLKNLIVVCVRLVCCSMLYSFRFTNLEKKQISFP